MPGRHPRRQPALRDESAGAAHGLEPGRSHVGWNRLDRTREDPLFDGLDDGTELYFVHSFAPEAVPANVVLATTLHGREFAAAAARGRIAGTQFHPEKSGEAGLRILANFLAGAGAKRASGATEAA